MPGFSRHESFEEWEKEFKIDNFLLHNGDRDYKTRKMLNIRNPQIADRTLKDGL
jgi:hypothetical protein